MKPYYEHGGITIYNADCRAVLGDLRADTVITDPPYGMNKSFANDTPAVADALVHEVIVECRRIVGDGNILAFWSAQRMDAIPSVFAPKRVMIWHKRFAIYSPNNVGYRYEPIVWVSGKAANAKRGDVFDCFPIMFRAQGENVGHPTQKPEDLMRELVRDFAGSVVLDPFMGSGSTLRAAKDCGRQAIGIELNELYCEIAAQRLSQEVLDLGGAA